MTLHEYINQVITDFTLANNREVVGTRTIEFDIGINPDKTGIIVQENSTNRIKFTLEVKRA